MKSTLVFLAAITLIGCNKKATEPAQGSIVTKLLLTNSQGIPTTIFRVGEDRFFSYTVTNVTTSKIREGVPCAPFFAVFKGETRVGTSFDPVDPNDFLAVAYITCPPLLAGESRVLKGSWLVNPVHRPLPAGKYTLMVLPLINFDGHPIRSIDFEVVP